MLEKTYCRLKTFYVLTYKKQTQYMQKCLNSTSYSILALVLPIFSLALCLRWYIGLNVNLMDAHKRVQAINSVDSATAVGERGIVC